MLTPEQRRPRERLHAVADSYFNTVELNDGIVFAPFDSECARTENGIVTTAAGAGSAGDISVGCENQFKLGIYKINKRIRERTYKLIDEERGVVVATGFFDHANYFDTYKTTDGKEIARRRSSGRTRSRWSRPSRSATARSIASRRSSRTCRTPCIRRSTSTSEVARPVTVVETRNPKAKACDRKCLIGLADTYTTAMVTQKPDTVPWAPRVRFTENSVPMMIGDGLVGLEPQEVDDAALCHGRDHRECRLVRRRARARSAVVSGPSSQSRKTGASAKPRASSAASSGPVRSPMPRPYKLDPLLDQVLPPALRQPRERMEDLVQGYYSTKQRNDGTIFTAVRRRLPAPGQRARRDGRASATRPSVAPRKATGSRAARPNSSSACTSRWIGCARAASWRVDEERGLVVATRLRRFRAGPAPLHDHRRHDPRDSGEVAERPRGPSTSSRSATGRSCGSSSGLGLPAVWNALAVGAVTY